MYNDTLESLISVALADGTLSEKERQILLKVAQSQGIDPDEFEMVLKARLLERQKSNDESMQKAVPKSDKYGSVLKCPACGAIVAAFNGVCQECGYEFVEVDANYSSRQLYVALSNATTTKQKQEIIETFPIPNTKADLLEFLTALKPRLLDTSSEFTNSYLKKYTECIEKIKVSFMGDKQLKPFVDEFSKLKRELLLRRLFAWVRKHPFITLLVAFILIGSIVPDYDEDDEYVPFGSQSEQSVKMTQSEYNEKADAFLGYIEDGEADEAMAVLRKMGVNHYDLAIDLIELYIEQGELNKAINVYEKLTPDHCSMQDMEWEMYRHGSNKRYEITATKLIREYAIKRENYDIAWEYSAKETEDLNDWRNAENYYVLMSDVVSHLGQKGKLSAARTFINRNCVWFTKNIDPKRDSDYSEEKAQYKMYNTKSVKTRLLQIVDNF